MPKRPFPGSAALVALLFVPAVALADPPGSVALDRAADRLHASVEVGDAIAACPADLWRTRLTLWHRVFGAGDGWTVEGCRLRFGDCAGDCLDASDGSACLHMARIFEKDEERRYVMPAREAYALACASGDPSGCTNRGAGIRNVPLDEDALSLRSGEEMAPCLMRSFAIACAAGDAWGCAMERQAHRLGEDGPVDAGTARERLTRACVLSSEKGSEGTEAAPCRFARGQMGRLSGKE